MKRLEIKFSFGEFLEDKNIVSRSPYLIYLYAFLSLFIFGIGIGFLRTNFKKSIKQEVIVDKPLMSVEKQIVTDKDIFKKIIRNFK